MIDVNIIRLSDVPEVTDVLFTSPLSENSIGDELVFQLGSSRSVASPITKEQQKASSSTTTARCLAISTPETCVSAIVRITEAVESTR